MKSELQMYYPIVTFSGRYRIAIYETETNIMLMIQKRRRNGVYIFSKKTCILISNTEKKSVLNYYNNQLKQIEKLRGKLTTIGKTVFIEWLYDDYVCLIENDIEVFLEYIKNKSVYYHLYWENEIKLQLFKDEVIRLMTEKIMSMILCASDTIKPTNIKNEK